MDITINRESLLNALNKVQGVLSKKEKELEILTKVRLDAKNGALSLLATDLDVSHYITLSAEVSKNGAICLPGVKLRDIAASSISDSLRIMSSDNDATITGQRDKYKLIGVPVKQFVEIPQPVTTQASLPGWRLIEMLRLASIAISSEEGRLALNTVKLEANDGQLRMVTSDGYRLMHTIGPAELTQPLDLTITRLAIRNIIALAEKEDSVGIGHSDTHVAFQTKTHAVHIRRHDIRFPDYKLVIPVEQDRHVAVFNSDNLKEAFRRIMIMADKTSPKVNMVVSQADLTMKASSSGEGDVTETVSYSQPYDGIEVKLSLNPKFVLDYLASITSQQVSLFLKDSYSQVEIRPFAGPDIKHRYIVMPRKEEAVSVSSAS